MSTELAIQQLLQRVEALERQLAAEPANSKKPKKAKADKPEKAKADKVKRKRNPTGYNFFVKEKRADAVSLLNGEYVEAPNSKEVMVKLGQMWNALSSNDKAVWNKRASDSASSASASSADEDEE
tara:strand:+ start:577 stop:951 length:375 start_codon:yes stop_codon:yes gene_type:complete